MEMNMLNPATPAASQPQANTNSGSESTAANQQQPEQALPSLMDSADQALKSATALYSAVDATLSRYAQQNPYGTLAAAAVAGFVVGGGLRSPIGQVLVRLSMRTLTPTMVNAAVQGLLDRNQGGFASHMESAL